LQQIDITNRLIQEEINYDTKYLQKEANKLYSQLNTEQRQAFHEIINTVLNNKAGFYFVSGHGGTGKTFLWNSIVSYLRAQKKCPNCGIIRSSFTITS
jgi:type II secretory ATPase GspE/PulE/Tfp pilus assembly ATPase PilB-like protein